MENQTLKLHDKVQQLIEQYTKDKARLNELELILKDKTTDKDSYEDQIKKLKSELQTTKEQNIQLQKENSDLKKRIEELQKMVESFEALAGNLNNHIDSLIPKLQKL
jgi:chromosome segregation ATPase